MNVYLCINIYIICIRSILYNILYIYYVLNNNSEMPGAILTKLGAHMTITDTKKYYFLKTC